MRTILLIGAGKSTSYLLQYLLRNAEKEQLHILVGDKDPNNAIELLNNHPLSTAIKLDIFNEQQRVNAIKKADLVISMLPARFHIQVAKDCLAYGKNMVTASYVSPDMEQLDSQVKNKGLIFLNEIGVDPGIDHMSAMKVIDEDRKSTRLNSSHVKISYAVFCLKKKK